MRSVTVRQRSCGRVMFSVVSVCSRGYVTITHDVLDFTVQGPPLDMFKLVQLLGPNCSGTHAPQPSPTPYTQTLLPRSTHPLVLTSDGY